MLPLCNIRPPNREDEVSVNYDVKLQIYTVTPTPSPAFFCTKQKGVRRALLSMDPNLQGTLWDSEGPPQWQRL